MYFNNIVETFGFLIPLKPYTFFNRPNSFCKYIVEGILISYCLVFFELVKRKIILEVNVKYMLCDGSQKKKDIEFLYKF